MKSSENYIAVPPGSTMKEQLEYRGMTQKEFAARMDLSEKHVSHLINGSVRLTPDVANRLESVLGVPAEFWNMLESRYREMLAKVEDENSMEEDIELLRSFPYAEMDDLGWVPKTRKAKEKVIALRKFFGVAKLTLLEKREITKIACKHLTVTDKSDAALMAWTQQARIEAREISTKSIDIPGLEKNVGKIACLTTKPFVEMSEELVSLLAGFGIAMVFLRGLKGLAIHGATFVDGNKIVIGITSDKKDIDVFRFVLFHELGHIILGHLNNPCNLTERDEKQADSWAQKILR